MLTPKSCFLFDKFKIRSAMEADAAVHTALLQQLGTLQAADTTMRVKPAGEPALLGDLNALTTSAFAGCKVNEPAPEGSTALLMVCALGVLADAQLLLAAGADPALEGVAEEDEERCQEFPLGAAAAAAVETRRVDQQQVTTDTGFNAFHCACHGGHREVVEVLLACEGIDVNAVTTGGATPLFTACDGGHTEVVGMLLACGGIAVNQATTNDGATPLIAACFDGHIEVVRMLLAREEIAVNQARTDDGATPLYVACDGGHTEVARMLLAREEIAVNQARTDDGATPLHAAAYYGHLAIAQQLVVFGADMTATDDANATPFQDATDQDHAALVEWLGAIKQWSPLRMAAGCRLHTSLTIQLKQGRMDPDATLSWSEMQLARDAATTPPTNLPWGNALEVCPITTKLIKAATRGWAPTAHWLHHTNIRTAVHTVLQVFERLHRQSAMQHGGGNIAPTAVVPPTLPPEMWMVIAHFFVRCAWKPRSALS
jgi:ankyrin repeat protein